MKGLDRAIIVRNVSKFYFLGSGSDWFRFRFRFRLRFRIPDSGFSIRPLTTYPANVLTESARQNKQTIPHSVKGKMPAASGMRGISGGKENVKKIQIIHCAFQLPP